MPRKKSGQSIEDMRGSSQPSNPTGRHVVTNLDGINNGGAQVVHWCPKEGTEWCCPGCGAKFVRDDDKRGIPWREHAVG